MEAKKSLGQNFLKSKLAISKIIQTGNISSEDFILEIGPGKGILTEALLQKGAFVLTIEKDKDLLENLENKFKEFIKNKKLEIKNEDILDFDLEKINGNYKLIANIPYYITGEILRKFLSNAHQPNQIVLLVQKEVAERICVKNGKESILSLSIKAYGSPRIISKVSKKYFYPTPKVDSAIISIEDISKERLGIISEKDFFKVIKEGFKHKRKILIQNLSSIFPKEKLEKAFSLLEINKLARAEDLDFPKWLILIEMLQK